MDTTQPSHTGKKGILRYLVSISDELQTVVAAVYPTNDSSVPALEEFALVEQTDT